MTGDEVASKYDIGKIKAENVAVGDYASVTSTVRVKTEQLPMQAEALHRLQNFITLLPDYADRINRPHEIEADAKAAENALSKKTLNRGHVEGLIRKMTVGVAGVAALANAVDAVQAAVTRLFT
jgi:hypothetical protein